MIKLMQLKPELGRLCANKRSKKELRRRLKAIKFGSRSGEVGKHLRAKWVRMLAKRTTTRVLARASSGEIEWRQN
jgi:hypothetical protein